MVKVIGLVAECPHGFRGYFVDHLAKAIAHGPPTHVACLDPVGDLQTCAEFSAAICTQEGPACKVTILLQAINNDVISIRLGLKTPSSDETQKLLDLWNACLIV